MQLLSNTAKIHIQLSHSKAPCFLQTEMMGRGGGGECWFKVENQQERIQKFFEDNECSTSNPYKQLPGLILLNFLLLLPLLLWLLLRDYFLLDFYLND